MPGRVRAARRSCAPIAGSAPTPLSRRPWRSGARPVSIDVCAGRVSGHHRVGRVVKRTPLGREARRAPGSSVSRLPVARSASARVVSSVTSSAERCSRCLQPVPRHGDARRGDEPESRAFRPLSAAPLCRSGTAASFSRIARLVRRELDRARRGTHLAASSRRPSLSAHSAESCSRICWLHAGAWRSGSSTSNASWCRFRRISAGREDCRRRKPLPGSSASERRCSFVAASVRSARGS